MITIADINLKTEKMCPLCGVNLQEIDVEKHFQDELEKLINSGLLFIVYI